MKEQFKQLLILALTSVALLACSGKAPQALKNVDGINPPAAFEPAEVVNLTIKGLLENPGRYDGKRVRVVGWAHLEFEGNIMAEGPDKRYGLPVKDVWLDVNREVMQERDKYSDRDVLVEGTFNARKHGHMGMSVGTIENITRFEPWDGNRKEESTSGGRV